MSNSYDVAVVGATGAVGREMIKTLHQRAFPVKSLLPLASSRTVELQPTLPSPLVVAPVSI